MTEDEAASSRAHEISAFLASGERFSFPSADGRTRLQAIRFSHRRPRGTIVVINGSTESWLKYGELFHDLFLQGYNIASYDHRGQGLSPHLVASNAQVAQIDDFGLYAADLDLFVKRQVATGKGGCLYLFAHSMGGAVAIDYLQHYSSPFRAVVLSAPMLKIRTAPYPEWFASIVMKTLVTCRMGDHYAPGKHDRDPTEPFKDNKITSSRVRWQETKRVWDEHPEAVLGGPSVMWVNQALEETSKIPNPVGPVTTPTLILEAGSDDFVINPSADELQRLFRSPRIVYFEGSKHEILMERDLIRDKAINATLSFFNN